MYWVLTHSCALIPIHSLPTSSPPYLPTSQVLQLYQITQLHHGLMMVGPSGSGKSTAWRVLLKALEKVEGVEGVAHIIDPKVNITDRYCMLVCRLMVCRLAVCRLAVCRLAVCRLAVCRLAVCRLAVCRLAVCRLAVCRQEFILLTWGLPALSWPFCFSGVPGWSRGGVYMTHSPVQNPLELHLPYVYMCYRGVLASVIM